MRLTKTLNTRLVFTVGKGLYHDGKPINPKAALEMDAAALALLCNAYGGVTHTTGYGNWTGPNGLVARESVSIFTVYAAGYHPVPSELCDGLLLLYGQGSIMVERAWHDPDSGSATFTVHEVSRDA